MFEQKEYSDSEHFDIFEYDEMFCDMCGKIIRPNEQFINDEGFDFCLDCWEYHQKSKDTNPGETLGKLSKHFKHKPKNK